MPSRRHSLHWHHDRPPSSLRTSFETRRRLGGRQPLCGIGVTSLIAEISSPAACSERIAASRPAPGPFTHTSTFFSPSVERFARADFGRDLRRERRALARALEADLAGAGPRDHVAVRVGDGHDRVVEGRLDVGHAVDAHLPLALLLRFRRCRRLLLLRHSGSFSLRFVPHAAPASRTPGLRATRPASEPASWRRPSPSAWPPPSSSDPCGCARSSACAGRAPAARAVPQPAVRADVHQSLDVHRDLAAQRALDLVLALDDLAQLGASSSVRFFTRMSGFTPVSGGSSAPWSRPDAEDVGQRDLDPLVVGQIDAGDTCHTLLLPNLWRCLWRGFRCR